jgi:TrmH family RNA methyltransferase
VRLFATSAALAAEVAVVSAAREAGAEVVEVSDAVLDAVATTVTPQGLVGVAALPPADLAAALRGATLAVVLVEVADPGNVGTVIRTADAAGADAVILSEGSADARNPKAVRASAGSLFSLPVVEGVRLDEALDAAAAEGLRLAATSPRATLDYDLLDLTGPTALVFGNEARGLPDEVVTRCDESVRIPLHGGAESLNLAASVAVLAYEAARQRRRAGR